MRSKGKGRHSVRDEGLKDKMTTKGMTREGMRK